MDEHRYTLKDVLRFLEFYNKQGLTLDDVIQILEYDGTLPRAVQNQSQPV